MKINNCFSIKITDEAKEFAIKYDQNDAHIVAENMFLKSSSVSGIYLLTLVNQEVLKVRVYEGILCAREINTKFIHPIYLGDTLICNLKYNDKEHHKYNDIIVRKSNLILSRDSTITTLINTTHYLKI